MVFLPTRNPQTDTQPACPRRIPAESSISPPNPTPNPGQRCREGNGLFRETENERKMGQVPNGGGPEKKWNYIGFGKKSQSRPEQVDSASFSRERSFSLCVPGSSRAYIPAGLAIQR